MSLVQPSPKGPNPLPREIAPGAYWLGDCLHFPHDYKGNELHGYNSMYLLAGETESILIEGGHPQDLEELDRQLVGLIESGVPAPRHVFTTHTETPHCGGFGRMLRHFPDLTAVGDISDMHLVFPDLADRFVPLAKGDSIDLGGSQFVIVESVFRDYLYTRWGFDTKRRILFAGDGFAYSHYHRAGQCGRVAEEVPDLDIPDMTSLFAELAFTWTRYVDIEPYLERLDELLFDELRVRIVAPTHGLPITDPEATMPLVREGLRIGSASRTIDAIT